MDGLGEKMSLILITLNLKNRPYSVYIVEWTERCMALGWKERRVLGWEQHKCWSHKE